MQTPARGFSGICRHAYSHLFGGRAAGARGVGVLRYAPERMLWASAWPHPSAPKDRPLEDADLLDIPHD